MTVWTWIGIGVGAAIAVPLLVGLIVARILGRIAEDVSSLLDQEEWSAAPLTRALESPEEAREDAAVDREPRSRGRRRGSR